MTQAMAETVGYVNRARSFMPPGTVPPFITRFDAGSVAVGQLVFSSATHTQGELQDFAHQPRAAAVRDPARRFRPAALRRKPDGPLSSRSIPTSCAVSDLAGGGHRGGQQGPRWCMPSGNMWTGKIERIARTNAALGGNLAELLSTPIRPVSGTTVYLRDIGTIENGTDIIYRLRPRQRQTDGLHPRHQARGRLHAGRDQRRQSGHPRFQESRARRCGCESAIRSVALSSPTRCAAWSPKACWARRSPA